MSQLVILSVNNHGHKADGGHDLQGLLLRGLHQACLKSPRAKDA